MAQQKAVEAPAEELEDLVDELPPGTKLLKGQYTITSYLNSGGFGITYLAKDSLDRNVVIKECFPSSFCRRSKAMVSARSRAHSAELRSVVQLFVKEARSLAKIVHPNIVAVHQVFEDNGTAYMAIDYVDGLDLQQIIDGQGTGLAPEQIVWITEKLLDAVGFIHDNDMLHRDISPDNVLVAKDGTPILIDFGAAREQASQKSRAMSALRVVKDGYSPQEFYIAGSEQGPWSDLYALGATLYHLISGEAPVNGQAEDRPDPYLPLDGRFAGYPAGFLRAIDVAMNTLPKQRMQSAREWLMMFARGAGAPAAAPAAAPKASGSAAPLDPIEAAVHEMVHSAQADDDQDAPADFSPPPALSRPVSQPRATSVQPTGPTVLPAARGGVGMVQVAAGIAVALAVVVGGLTLLGGQEPAAETASASAPDRVAAAAPEPASAPASATGAPPDEAPQTVAATPEPVAEPAPETVPQGETVTAAAEPVAEPAAPASVDPAPVDPAPVDPAPVDPAPVEAALVETAAAEVAAPAAAETAAPLRENQVSFAAWDVEMPFIETNRVVGNRRVAVVQRILPTANLAEAGSFLAPGLLIYSVNGADVQQSGSVAAAVLNALNVDPDGRARVVVQYAGSSLETQTGLMTVTAKRIVSLANGVNLRISNVDGEWRTVVDSVTRNSVTTLRPGDVLFRNKSTGATLDGPQSLERIMAMLVADGVAETEFSIIRDNKLGAATLRLAQK